MERELRRPCGHGRHGHTGTLDVTLSTVIQDGCGQVGSAWHPRRVPDHTDLPRPNEADLTEIWLWYVDQALGEMTAILTGLGDELASTRPDLPGANSPYAIVTHCCGVLEAWGGEAIAGRRIERDRPAEFRATGAVSDLVAKVAAARARLIVDLAGVDWAAAPRGPVDPQDADLPLGRSQGGVLLHIYEELAQHLGHLELTRDVLRHAAGGG